MSVHLKKHGMNVVEYEERHPGAAMVDPAFRAKMSALKKAAYSDDPTLRSRVSFGTKRGMHTPEAWEKFREHISTRDTTSFDRHFKSSLPETKVKMYTPERNEKVSAGKKAWWDDGRAGKTIEELLGEERGLAFRRLKSEQTRGELNPAYGKVYENVGRIRGHYKGHLFRSLWEYSFWKYLEAWGADVLDRGQVAYEPLSIPFKLDGHARTYHPDFLLPSIGVMIEIKSEYGLREMTEFLATKFEAARLYCEERGWVFRVMTEEDFPIISFRIAKRDPNVEWLRK